MASYPYLDLSVAEEIRELLVSRRAAIILSRDLKQVYWANGEGTRLLGQKQVSDALEKGLNRNSVMTRQIVSAAARLADNQSINAAMRVKSGWTNKLVNFSLSIIAAPDGEQLVLLVTDPLYGPARSLVEMAKSAVSCLDGAGHVSAILDNSGDVIAASSGFGELDIAPDALAGLVEEVIDEDDRMVKRPFDTGKDALAAGIAKLTDDPALHLLILASAPDESDVEDIADVPRGNSPPLGDVIEEEAPTGDLPDKTRSSGLSSRRGLSPPNDDNGRPVGRWDYDNNKLVRSDDDSGLAEPEIKQHSEAGKPAGHIEPDDSQSQHADIGGETSAQMLSSFKFETTSRPVRFAWRMDQDGVFSSISPELAKTLGPAAANVEGYSWKAVTERLGFDENGDISSLLKKGDTWSGKSVLWPVEGVALRVPVDLAGLPSFSKDRQFSGFHGFGTIRSNEAAADPAETGLFLLNTQTDGSKKDDKGSGPAGEETGNADTASAETEQRPFAANDDHNVVELKELRRVRDSRKLSTEDQATFAEIGEKLTSGNDATDDRQEAARASQHQKKPEPEPYLPSAFADSNKLKPASIDTSILERLPIPVVIFKDNKVYFTNREFTELTGYRDIDHLVELGSIETLLGSPDGEQDGYTRIVDSSGNLIPVRANLQSVPWAGSRALLLALEKNVNDLPGRTDGSGFDTPFTAAINVHPSEQELPVDGFQGISSRELSGILDTATDGVVVLSSNGEIRSINRAAEALFGYDASSVTGESFTRLLAPESHRAAKDYIAGLSENGVASLLNDGREMIGKEAQGGLIPLFVTIGRLEESDGYCAVLRDITQWKKAEEDLVAARRQAELANDQKTDFLAKISHEIRTPLNAIIGFSDVMLEERFGKISIDRYREYLRDINRSGSHVLELVNDLLDISKIEAGKLELDFGEVKLNDIIAEGVALTQPQANRDHIIIRTSLSGAVPTIVADPRSIRQIILNLVSNAIKYTREGGQVIVSTVFEETGEVVLRVRDTGIGMTESEITTALMPFRRIQTISRQNGEGTGLGLPLTKALVEANRAQFSIESTPGEGTLVEIFFPPTRVLTE